MRIFILFSSQRKTIEIFKYVKKNFTLFLNENVNFFMTNFGSIDFKNLALFGISTKPSHLALRELKENFEAR